MTETSSVKDQVQKLVDLQKVDKEIYHLKNLLKEKPAIISDLKNQFEESKRGLLELEEKHKSIQLSRKELELELQTKEDEIAKSNAQLSAIKTNKEYTAKITEIENFKSDKSIVEEKILVSYDDSDGVMQEIEKEKENVRDRENEFLTKEKEIKAEIADIEQRIQSLDAQRSQIIPDIEKNYLKQYSKILDHKSGVAIVPVHGTTCGGCFMNITPQLLNEIKMQNKLVSCEMCARLLYVEEDL